MIRRAYKVGQKEDGKHSLAIVIPIEERVRWNIEDGDLVEVTIIGVIKR